MPDDRLSRDYHELRQPACLADSGNTTAVVWRTLPDSLLFLLLHLLRLLLLLLLLVGLVLLLLLLVRFLVVLFIAVLRLILLLLCRTRLAVPWVLIPRGCVVWADRRMSSRPRRLSMSMSLSTSGTKAGAGDGIILEELFELAITAIEIAKLVVPCVS